MGKVLFMRSAVEKGFVTGRRLAHQRIPGGLGEVLQGFVVDMIHRWVRVSPPSIPLNRSTRRATTSSCSFFLRDSSPEPIPHSVVPTSHHPTRRIFEAQMEQRIEDHASRDTLRQRHMVHVLNPCCRGRFNLAPAQLCPSRLSRFR